MAEINPQIWVEIERDRGIMRLFYEDEETARDVYSTAVAAMTEASAGAPGPGEYFIEFVEAFGTTTMRKRDINSVRLLFGAEHAGWQDEFDAAHNRLRAGQQAENIAEAFGEAVAAAIKAGGG